MKFIMNIIKYKEYRAKREALYQFRGMTERNLIDCNISVELLNRGIKAWPWQATPDDFVHTRLQYLKQVDTQVLSSVNTPSMEQASSDVQGSLCLQAAVNKQTKNTVTDLALDVELQQKPTARQSAA